MDDSEVGIHAAIRALSDVVAPAVDPQSAQAGDQLRLAVDYLGFMVQRLDYLHARNRWELRHHLQMANALQAVVHPRGAKETAELTASAAHADRLLSAGNASAEGLRAATARLAAAVSDLVKQSADFDPAARRQVEQRVLQASQERIAFERAWYLPLGLDPDSHETRPLAEFLSAA